jgi:hypothetical protein
VSAEHPSQQEYIDLLQNKTTEGEAQTMLNTMRTRSRQALDRVFEQVDVLVALAESNICTYASAAGKHGDFLAYRETCLPSPTGWLQFALN